MVLFSVVFWGLRGLILLGVVEPSDFMWRLVPGRSFGVSSHALVVVIFILMWGIVPGPFFCYFLGYGRTFFAVYVGAIYFWVDIDSQGGFSPPPPCFGGGVFCDWGGELFRDIFSVVFCALRGLFVL